MRLVVETSRTYTTINITVTSAKAINLMRRQFVITSLAAVILSGLLSLYWPTLSWLLATTLVLTAIGVYDMTQTKHSLRRNFPLLSRGRWLIELLRPFIRQYLLESDTDGAPINRMFRSVVYQRAKGELDSVPFGTKLDTYRVGYEWIGHSMAANTLAEADHSPRVTVGGPHCKQPYSASLLNISAMSFGALSKNAILALNKGAKTGGFAHNTGEGGISDYHLEHGGDLIWQIGTGYFGCRTESGTFCAESFAKKASQPSIKMIEIKLSQGAKPGHGGILPAEKNSAEIARIRHVTVGTQVNSPSVHSAFSTPIEMMNFIQQLRELAQGKPVGFKLAIGRRSEFVALCKAMVETGITPDFITVDGGEGGTGAAPLEYSNSIGMPLRDALAFVCDCLNGFDLKKDIKVIASGKILTGFHLVKNLSLGADMCNSARGMMLALGCVQSLICNTNHCPTGVATQNEKLANGLVVPSKAERVARFHKETVKSAMEIVASAGLKNPSELDRTYIYRRVSQQQILRYDEVFPYCRPGQLKQKPYPKAFAQEMAEATAKSFVPSTRIAVHETGLEQLPENTQA